jgi:hypothetical protein
LQYAGPAFLVDIVDFYPEHYVGRGNEFIRP